MLLRLSRKGDYGIILACALARTGEASPISLSKIAKEYNLPQTFVARLASQLKKFGILKSQEGAKGGYTLAKNPSKITLFEILEALEGPLVGHVCCQEGSCRIEAICPSKGPWAKIADELAVSLKEKTLADLLQKKGGREYGQHPSYF